MPTIGRQQTFKELNSFLLKVKMSSEKNETQVETIVDTLCSFMISNDEQLRDISSIALKTVIAELSPNSASLVSTICKKITDCLAANPQTFTVLGQHLDSIWKLLVNHCECPEEGIRNVVAECLGKLTLIDPINLLPRLQKYLLSESPLARSTAVTAMKFTISDQPLIDALLRNTIGDFFKTLQDPDMNVRRVALVAFNSAAHNKPSLIRDLLDSILPQLYNETKIRKELIREVEMGHTNIHTIDEGLDIRKAAFECMYTLLDSCLDRIDIFEFLNHVEYGLSDDYNIKMLSYLILIRLSTLYPFHILQRLGGLVEPLKNTCVDNTMTNELKQEIEKQDKLKRSAMKAFLALLAVPEADKNNLMTEFQMQIESTPELSNIYQDLQLNGD